jgi:hypothetical protein
MHNGHGKGFAIFLVGALSLGVACCRSDRKASSATEHVSKASYPSQPLAPTVPVKVPDPTPPVDLHPIVVGNAFGFIDEEGSIRIAPSFDYAQHFAEGLAVVRSNGKYGYINAEGKFAIEPKYDDAQDFSEGAAAVKVGGKWGYIDKNDTFLIQPAFNFDRSLVGVPHFSDGYVHVEQSAPDFSSFSDSLIDRAAKEFHFTYPCKFMFSSNFREGYVWVWPACPLINYPSATTNDEFVINKLGKITSPTLQLRFTGDFHEGLATAQTPEHKWGYVSPSGTWVVKPQFDNAMDFSEGLARVSNKIDGVWKYGYINKKGENVTPLAFDDGGKFSGQRALVGSDFKWGIIDPRGEWVIPPTFDGSAEWDGKLGVIVSKDGWPNARFAEALKNPDPASKAKDAAAFSAAALVETFIDRSGKIIWQSQPISAAFLKSATSGHARSY